MAADRTRFSDLVRMRDQVGQDRKWSVARLAVWVMLLLAATVWAGLPVWLWFTIVIPWGLLMADLWLYRCLCDEVDAAIDEAIRRSNT